VTKSILGNWASAVSLQRPWKPQIPGYATAMKSRSCRHSGRTDAIVCCFYEMSSAFTVYTGQRRALFCVVQRDNGSDGDIF